jgi:hypothetical protein
MKINSIIEIKSLLYIFQRNKMEMSEYNLITKKIIKNEKIKNTMDRLYMESMARL